MHGNTRYYVVKAPRENLELSYKEGLWATQRENEHKLNSAYCDARVVLLFSAVKSNRFLGFASMISQTNPKYQAKWRCPTHIKLSDCFRVAWECVADVCAGQKPYFDCQELSPDQGRHLCQQMIDNERDRSGVRGKDEAVHHGRGKREEDLPRGNSRVSHMQANIPPSQEKGGSKSSMRPTRFFVVKSEEEHMDMSIHHGLWAMQR